MTKLISAVMIGFMAFVAMGMSAQAGIIVTVGKPMPEDQAKRQARAGAVAVYPPPSETSTPGEKQSPTACYVDKTGVTVCSQKLDPFTGMPADWNCVPIGNGQLYCEGPGIGVGPGEGGEGYFDPSYDVGGIDEDEADTEIEAMGCAGAAGAGGGIFAVMTVVSVFVLLIRGRRRR